MQTNTRSGVFRLEETEQYTVFVLPIVLREADQLLAGQLCNPNQHRYRRPPNRSPALLALSRSHAHR